VDEPGESTAVNFYNSSQRGWCGKKEKTWMSKIHKITREKNITVDPLKENKVRSAWTNGWSSPCSKDGVKEKRVKESWQGSGKKTMEKWYIY